MVRGGQKGVSLPEVLLVILILGLLAATVIPRLVYSSETRSGECRANVAMMNAKIEFYFTKTVGRSPASAEEFERLITGDRNLFPNGLPKCPYGWPYDYDRATGHIVPHRH